MSELLAAGADPNLNSTEGLTPLLAAIVSNQPAVTEVRLAAHMRGGWDTGRPLAGRHGRRAARPRLNTLAPHATPTPARPQSLLVAGADPNAPGAGGEVPLVEAVKAAADPAIVLVRGLWERRPTAGAGLRPCRALRCMRRPCLSCACGLAWEPPPPCSLQALLESGASVDLSDGTGLTALAAAQEYDPTVLPLLREYAGVAAPAAEAAAAPVAEGGMGMRARGCATGAGRPARPPEREARARPCALVLRWRTAGQRRASRCVVCASLTDASPPLANCAPRRPTWNLCTADLSPADCMRYL